MQKAMIEQYILALPEVTTIDQQGYQFYFYATAQVIPFVSIAVADNAYDNISNLDREGVYRVNIGVLKETFQQLFTDINNEWDYTVLNTIMPHPHYAAQHFICVLNPGDELSSVIYRLIDEAYEIAKKRFEKKQS